MCQPKGYQYPGQAGCISKYCGCGCDLSFRRFFSAKEELECLENYRGQIKKELAGVEERLKELQGQ